MRYRIIRALEMLSRDREVSETFYIETEDELKQFCNRLADAECIGLDTEFLREKTYYAKPCLLQVSGNGLIACIDPLAIEHLSALRDVLFDEGIIKILHACRQDLEVLLQMFDAIPVPVFDTQLAAAFCGHGDQVSYAALVEELAGVSLPKAHTRARWCQRPLSDDEICYAEDDVRYLVDLYTKLDNALQERGRKDWFDAGMQGLTDLNSFEIINADAWTRIGAIRSLRGQAFHAAKRLATWREETARRRDLPRRWVMADQLVIALAEQRPEDLQALAGIEGMTDGLLKHRGRQLLDAIADTSGNDDSEGPPVSARPDAREKALSKQLAKLLDEKAAELDMPASLLATRRELMAMVQGDRSLNVLKGWRGEVIGAKLLEQLEKNA